MSGTPDRDLLDEMIRELGTLPEAEKYNVDKAWLRMQTSVTKPKSSKSRIYQYLSVAAAIIIAIAGIKYLPITSAPETKTYSTAPAQRATIKLADGSRVTLAPATTIRVVDRKVDLDGEALFTVTQHTSTPFTVTSNGTTTRVLGTTFGIRAYDSNVRVVVAEGKVDVNNSVLSTGDVASVTPGARATISHSENVSAMLAWAQGRLVFHLTPLREMITDLERWYNIDIQVADEKLLDRKLTVTLTDESPEQAIRVITLALGVSAEDIQAHSNPGPKGR